MSAGTHPTNASAPGTDGIPVTPVTLGEQKARGEPIVMVTAYDYPSARAAETAGVDVVLVGDSAATTVLGYPSTVPVTLAEMVMLAAAARRGLRTPLLVVDLPFGSYERSDDQAIESAQRLVKEAGCEAVKLERGGTSADRARAIVAAGIPVMGHVGLTPQTVAALGGFRARGRTAEQAAGILDEATALQDAGCFAIVLEAVPSPVTELVAAHLAVPTIGIGAGPSTDGQVLVFHDLLGITEGRTARFVKRYADIATALSDGIRAYADEVRSRQYPAPEHAYTIRAEELDRVRWLLATETVAPDTSPVEEPSAGTSGGVPAEG